MSQKSRPTDKLKSAVGKGKSSNQHITKITAKPSHPDTQDPSSPQTTSEPAHNPHRPTTQVEGSDAREASLAPSHDKSTPQTPAKSTEKSRKSRHRQHNSAPSEKPLKQVFILARPFVGLGRYARDSWREIRQVRWPNRKATWKMTLAVLIYCAILMVFILLLDTLFTFLVNLIIQK